MTQVHQEAEHLQKCCINTTQVGMSKAPNQERQGEQKITTMEKRWEGNRKRDKKRLQNSESDFLLQAKEAV